MTTSNEESVFGVALPTDVLEAAEKAANEVLPTKSKLVYEQNYGRFIKWCTGKNIDGDYSESVLLAYFKYMADDLKFQIPTLWSHYSMIKCLLKLRKGVDIANYHTLRLFLKKKNENYCPKKASVLTKEDFDRFLVEAPDDKYLGIKVNYL